MIADLDGGEIWKNARVLNGKLEVSNLGRVRHVFSGKVYSQFLSTRGYLYIKYELPSCAECPRIRRKLKVHRLVCMAFIDGFSSSGLQVDHINGVKTDNRLENLRPATNSDNQTNQRAKRHTSTATEYRGVTRVDGRFRCLAVKHGKSKVFRRDTLLNAALDRDCLAREIHGEFAYLHFPMPFVSNGDWMKTSPPENPSVTCSEF